MKCHAFLKAALFASLTLLVMFSGPASAQQSRRGGLSGDWIVKSEFNGRQMESVVSFSRDREGNVTGQWIGFMGINELKDVKSEEGQLSFTRISPGRDGQSSTSTFKGSIAEGKLSGTVSSERGEYPITGERAPRMPRAAGIWELKLKMNDREVPATLTLGVDKEGALTAQWKSERGEPAITDIQYDQGKLTFKAKSTSTDRPWEAAFEGTIERDTLSGVLKSERGETAVEGKRMGVALIGAWNLEVVSDRGTRAQRLTINPDMTGRYGATPIKKVNFQDGKVDFQIVLQFGDQPFEMNFSGKIEDSKLVGELTTSQGSQKITGTKVVRTFGRRNAG